MPPRRARPRYGGYDNLDNSQKALVDIFVNYDVTAEKCAAYLRQQDKALLKRLWEEQTAVFMNDPVTYPSAMVEYKDMEGRIRFHEKCQALLFPPGSQRPLEDHILMYFAAIAGMHVGFEEATENRSDLCAIANDEALKIIGKHLDQDSKDELDYNDDGAYQMYQYPAELIDQKIRCRDNSSGEIMEYVVVDYIKSFIEGDYFMLEDQQGRRYNVTPEELHETRVDDNSIELQPNHVLHKL